MVSAAAAAAVPAHCFEFISCFHSSMLCIFVTCCRHIMILADVAALSAAACCCLQSTTTLAWKRSSGRSSSPTQPGVLPKARAGTSLATTTHQRRPGACMKLLALTCAAHTRQSGTLGWTSASGSRARRTLRASSPCGAATFPTKTAASCASRASWPSSLARPSPRVSTRTYKTRWLPSTHCLLRRVA